MVTGEVCAAWVVQPSREPFPGDTSARYLIHDNDPMRREYSHFYNAELVRTIVGGATQAGFMAS